MDDTLTALMEVKLDQMWGLDIDHLPIAGSRRPIDKGNYWAKRKNDRIYFHAVLYAHLFCQRKESVADVGPHCSPLVLIVPGFKRRFAIDPQPATAEYWCGVDGAVYISDYLENIEISAVNNGDCMFDLILCNQVIEHLDEPARFADLLCRKGRRIIISTTFDTPAGHMRGHVQDPISLEKFESWFSRKMMSAYITRGPIGGKILAVF
jgi:hypothetical protein